MLDSSAPNPLAKNPNIHTHKVFASVGLILIGTIIAIAAIWYFVGDSPEIGKDEKVSTTSAKVSTGSSTVKTDKYVTWKDFQNSEAGFSLKYPSTWLIRSYQDGNLCNSDHTFLSPTDNALGVCSSGVGGLISITRTPVGAGIDSVSNDYQEHNFTGRTDQTLTLDGKTVKRISGTSNLVSLTDDFTGHKFIVYLVDLGDRTLIIQYNQPPDYGDHSAEFEDIVASMKFD